MRAHQVYYIVQHFFKSCSLQLVKARARKAAKEGGSSRPVVAKSNLRAWTLLTNYFLLLSFFVLTVFTVLCEARIVINIRALKEHFQTGKTSRSCVSGCWAITTFFAPLLKSQSIFNIQTILHFYSQFIKLKRGKKRVRNHFLL